MGECPATLDALFSDETVTVDAVDHNAARTWKFYGPCHGKATVRWSGSLSRLQRRSASPPWSGSGTSWGSFPGKSLAKEGDRQCRHPVATQCTPASLPRYGRARWLSGRGGWEQRTIPSHWMPGRGRTDIYFGSSNRVCHRRDFWPTTSRGYCWIDGYPHWQAHSLKCKKLLYGLASHEEASPDATLRIPELVRPGPLRIHDTCRASRVRPLLGP